MCAWTKAACVSVAIALAIAACNRSTPAVQPAASPAPDPVAASTDDDVKTEQPAEVDVSTKEPTAPPTVEIARYQDDLEFIAKPRPPGSKHWQAVQDLCKTRLAALGYQVQLHAYGTGVNVIGKRVGSKAPAEHVILSAHYDSTDDTCPGADDNGSGVAGLLEAARVLAAQSHERTLLIACWDQEEFGLVGSRAWAAEARKRNDVIAMMFAFEMIGYAKDTPDTQMVPPGFDLLFPEQIASVKANKMRGDFIALVHDDAAEAVAATAAFMDAATALPLPTLPLKLAAALKNNPMVNDLRRSDHAAFWEQDYPAMMLTDTANFRNANYHCTNGPDTVDRLDPVFATRVVAGAVAAVEKMLQSP